MNKDRPLIDSDGEVGNLGDSFFATARRGRPALLPGDKKVRMNLMIDADIAAKVPLIPRWKAVFENAGPRPAAAVKGKYNEVSARFWSAVHDTLSGSGTAAENLELLELDLSDMQGSGW